MSTTINSCDNQSNQYYNGAQPLPDSSTQDLEQALLQSLLAGNSGSGGATPSTQALEQALLQRLLNGDTAAGSGAAASDGCGANVGGMGSCGTNAGASNLGMSGTGGTMAGSSTPNLEQALLQQLTNGNTGPGFTGASSGSDVPGNPGLDIAATPQLPSAPLAPASYSGPGLDLAPASGSTPQLTGDVNQDVNTLQQLQIDPTISDQALRTFALGVAGEAANAGDTSSAEWAIDWASELGGTTPSTDPATPTTGSTDLTSSTGTTTPTITGPAAQVANTIQSGFTSIATASESQYKVDMESALDKVAQAKKGAGEGPLGALAAESEFAAAQKLADKAKSEASGDAELVQATTLSGATEENEAAAIWQSGQAGPGHSQHDQYDKLMDSANAEYDSVANDPNASSTDKSAAQKFSSDISDMKAATDGGNSGKSQVYATAAADFANGAVLDAGASISTSPSSGTSATTLSTTSTPPSASDVSA
jgi:hypothetical protein